MEVKVHRDALLLPKWVPAWGHGFGDLVAVILMSLTGKHTVCEATLEVAGCSSWRQGRQVM